MVNIVTTDDSVNDNRKNNRNDDAKIVHIITIDYLETETKILSPLVI
jgi:hypothetical protein